MSRVTKLFAAAAATALLLPAARALAEPVTYTATFNPVNNSGVTGTADLALDGSTLTVSVNATGLEPNQNHPQHIHGFANGTPSVIPPFPPTPDVDTNGNGLLDDPEAEALIGPPILGLTGTNSTGNVSPAGSGEPGGENAPSTVATDYPAVGADGALTYQGTFTVDPTLFADLTTRALEIHGLTANARTIRKCRQRRRRFSSLITTAAAVAAMVVAAAAAAETPSRYRLLHGQGCTCSAD